MRHVGLIAAIATPLIAGGLVTSAFSQATVPFVGAVAGACTLTVGIPGVIAPTPDYTRLSSKQSPGVAGTVAAVSTSAAFAVTADAPTAFRIAPNGGGDNVSFSTTYQASGATSVGDTSGLVPTGLLPGVTNLQIDLEATKNSGVFPQGAYEADVVVRCE